MVLSVLDRDRLALRFSRWAEALERRALTATSTLEPDMEITAISGSSVSPNGSNTPAAIGSAGDL